MIAFKKGYLILLLCPIVFFGQDLEKIGKSSIFKLTGGVAANAVFYDGTSDREPFSYFVSGNVNLNISDVYNVPFSFSYSNNKLQSNNPFSFNRLSMHPSYKWVTAHIGDVNMTFSPYTLSGHQFTGLGVDLSPGKKFKISLMYGRLLEETEYDEENLNEAATYKRIGYGLKTSYKFEKGTLGLIVFKAKDDEGSLKEPIPIESDIQPKDNAVVSIDGDFNINKNINVKAEIAYSMLTEDTRADSDSDGISSLFLNTNASTQNYKAYNIDFTYKVGKGMIGLGYEFIDPNYQTLGGYFFNNDLENITVNAAQRIFKDKLGITFNAGLQRDDLNNAKSTQLLRMVSAVNLTFKASKKLDLTAGYSNFQSFTNIKNQFDFINEVSQIDNDLDQANISQISQNANLSANYILKETKSNRQNLNFGLTYQNAVNKIDDVSREEDNSSLYNGNLVYSVGYPNENLNISGALNMSTSILGEAKSIVAGPTLSANKSYLEKKLKLNGAVSYNQSINEGIKEGEITNLRLGARYTYKKRHNFNLTSLLQMRNSSSSSTQNLTVTFGYSYQFGSFSSDDIRFKRKNKKKTKKVKTKNKDLIKFKYKDSIYQGTSEEINLKLAKLIESPQFKKLPHYKKEELNTYRKEIKEEKNKKAYKIKAIQYLKDLYGIRDYTQKYNDMLFTVVKDLSKDLKRLDYVMEKEYVDVRKRIDIHELRNKSIKDRLDYSETLQEEYNNLADKETKSLSKLVTHRWITPKIVGLTSLEKVNEGDEYLDAFYKKHSEQVFKMIDNKKDKEIIKLYLLNKIIEFYAEESKKHIDLEKYEMKYFYKN